MSRLSKQRLAQLVWPCWKVTNIFLSPPVYIAKCWATFWEVWWWKVQARTCVWLDTEMYEVSLLAFCLLMLFSLSLWPKLSQCCLCLNQTWSSNLRLVHLEDNSWSPQSMVWTTRSRLLYMYSSRLGMVTAFPPEPDLMSTVCYTYRPLLGLGWNVYPHSCLSII